MKVKSINAGMVGLLLLFSTGLALPTNYALPWRVMNGGGQPAQNGSGTITLKSTASQTAIGPGTGAAVFPSDQGIGI